MAASTVRMQPVRMQPVRMQLEIQANIFIPVKKAWILVTSIREISTPFKSGTVTAQVISDKVTHSWYSELKCI